jgi:hypothetical protein
VAGEPVRLPIKLIVGKDFVAGVYGDTTLPAALAKLVTDGLEKLFQPFSLFPADSFVIPGGRKYRPVRRHSRPGQ